MVDIGPRILWSAELKVGWRYPCRRSKFRGERPINNRGPLSAPFIWDVPPVIVVQQPDSGEGTTGDGRTQSWLHRFTTTSQGYRSAGCSCLSSPPTLTDPWAASLPSYLCIRPYNFSGMVTKVISTLEPTTTHFVTLGAHVFCFASIVAYSHQVLRLSFCILSVDPPYRRSESCQQTH